MPAYVALLRAINVGGRNRIAMGDLRAMFAGLGFRDVQTLLQSGNVVFHGSSVQTASLERRLEAETKRRFGIDVDYLVRSAKDCQRVLADNPFPREAERDPSHLLVMFLKDAARPRQVQTLQDSIRGRETLRARGKHLYVVYPDGIGTSKLSGGAIEKHLATRGTGRNWNTLLKLTACCAT